MRILLLSGHHADRDLAAALAGYGHNVVFAGANLHGRRIVERLCEASRIAAREAGRAELIILDGSAYDSTVATMAHRAKGVPLLLYLKGHFPTEYDENSRGKRLGKAIQWYTMNHLIRSCSHVVYVSRWLQDKYFATARIATIKDKPSSIIPVGGDAFFCPDEGQASHRQDAETSLCYAGNFDYLEKARGVLLLLDAFSLVSKLLPGLRLYICSDGRHRRLLQERAVQLNLMDRVVFTGRVSKAELRDYYRKSYAFVYASFLDGSPRTVIEAQACGTPAIVTYGSGAAELVDNGVSGIVCQPSVESLADSIAYLVQNPGIRSSMAAQAAEHARRSLSWEAAGAKFNEVIAGLRRVDSGEEEPGR